MSDQPDHSLSASGQQYIKTIYAQTRSGTPTSTVALAQALAVRPASVTNMLQKMAQEVPCLLDYRKHHGVSLTPAGEQVALALLRHHRLIEQFLFQVLGYPLDRVHSEAENLEPSVSPYFVERLANLLGDPPFDPHGDPIPDRRLKVRDTRSLQLLAGLPPGSGGIVRRISNQDPALLEYLRSVGIQPGTRILVRQVNPLDGALQVSCPPARKVHALGRDIAAAIHVEKEDEE